MLWQEKHPSHEWLLHSLSILGINKEIWLQRGCPGMQCWPLERAAQMGQGWPEPGQVIVKEPLGPCLSLPDCRGWTDGLVAVFACRCSWEGLCWLPTDIPAAGVPATVVFSPSLLSSGVRRSFGRSKECLAQSWWSELVHSLGSGLHREVNQRGEMCCSQNTASKDSAQQRAFLKTQCGWHGFVWLCHSKTWRSHTPGEDLTQCYQLWGLTGLSCLTLIS